MQAHRRHRVAYALALIGLALLLLLLITRPLEGQGVRDTIAETRGTVMGFVYDSLERRPLAGARALLVGTDHQGQTDTEGHFWLTAVSPGQYSLRVHHPAAGVYGLTPIDRALTVRAGGTVIVDLAFPSLSTVLSRICPDTGEGQDRVHPDEPSIILGFVREEGSGEPVPGARVWIGYSDFWGDENDRWTAVNKAWNQVAIESDETGAYLACGMPGNWRVIAQAEADGAASDTVWRRTPPGDLLRLDLEISPTREGPGALGLDRRAAFGEAPDPAADAEPRTATLLGTVKSIETGDPVSAAHVRLVGTDIEQVTGRDGTFVMEDLGLERYRIATEHQGMVSDTAIVDLRGGGVSLAVLTLETRPIELPTLEVEVEGTYRNPRIAGFHQRMKRGLGDFITREDLELGDVVSNFRRIPNVRVDQCSYGVGVRVGDCWDVRIARGIFTLREDPPCRPLVYIDGHLLSGQLQDMSGEFPGENPFSQLQRYPRHRIEGIEVYHNPASAPGQYRMLGDACGIVLVWTSRGPGGG